MTTAGVSFNLRRIPKKGTQPAFWMGETPVTQKLWRAIMGRNPSQFKGDGMRPVERVSWDDCQTFLKKLNARDEVRCVGLTFRLPTETEWEHACRAGSTGAYCRSANGTEITSTTLGSIAWFADKFNLWGMTHPVGQKEPNAYGLYDMHGNVWEWTQTVVGEDCVNRGGSWCSSAKNCESSVQGKDSPSFRDNSLGFRLCTTGRAEAPDG